MRGPARIDRLTPGEREPLKPVDDGISGKAPASEGQIRNHRAVLAADLERPLGG